MAEHLLMCSIFNLVLTVPCLLASIGNFRPGSSRENGGRNLSAIYLNVANDASQMAFALILLVAVGLNWPQRTTIIIVQSTLFCQASLEVRLFLCCSYLYSDTLGRSFKYPSSLRKRSWKLGSLGAKYQSLWFGLLPRWHFLYHAFSCEYRLHWLNVELTNGTLVIMASLDSSCSRLRLLSTT